MANEIKNVSMIGAGTMGRNIAGHAVLYGFNFHLVDLNSKALEEAEKYITGAMKRSQKKENQGTVTYHTDLSEALENADLVIEAVPEDLDLKKKVFSRLDAIAPPNAIIATNSSSIPVSKLEDSVERKDKVLNIHFYLPIGLHNMVDIMKGTQTSDDTFERGKKWIEDIGCVPLVVKKECLGFVFNRVWHAIKKECLKIWAGGYADIETLDQAWKIFTGMPYGPFTMMDNVGLDVILGVEMSYYNESGDPNDKPPQELIDMVERGDLGFKSGKGFYTYKKKR